MQGRSDPQREILDVESVAGHLLPEGGVFAFLAAHRRGLFPEEMFADLFKPGGRPSVPAEVIASVIVLQTLHGLSDTEAVESVTFDLRWKAACGLAITATAFHPTTLTYWRRRLAASDRPNRIFDAVRAVIAQTGVLAGKTRRAVDSTVLDDAVATQDTVTQLIAAIRRVGRDVPGAAAVIAAHCAGHDYTQPGKPRIAWDDPVAREQLLNALLSDAHRLLGQLPEQELAAKPAEAVALLALVAGQDVEPAEDSDGTDGRWRIARRVAPDRVISTVDTQARHAHKTRARRQDGYQAHIVVEPDTGIITDTALTPASGADNSDATVGVELLLGIDQQPEQPERWEVLADSAYGTGNALDAIVRAGHTPIIKPWPLRPAVDGGFTLDDFTVTEPDGDQPGSVTCPNGITRPISPRRGVSFGVGCRGCPLRTRCTTSKTGRSLTLHPFDVITRAHRERARQPRFQTVYRQHRPMVERSISWLVAGGNRRLRFRGTGPNNQWLHHRVAGLNLRRLLALGLTRTAGTWSIAAA
ncbi:MAG TPA: IS1182 family transposase [Pseudonocardiaceae bacterium]